MKSNKKENILCVPIQSVTLRPKNKEKEDSEKIQVAFIVKEGKIIQKEVKTGIQDDSYIEILSGISLGEEVVTAPFKAISKELENDKDDTEVEVVFSADGTVLKKEVKSEGEEDN